MRLNIQGFFREPLPVSPDVGLVYLLEDLPRLLRFLTSPSQVPCVIGLWDQGIEAEFSFLVTVGGDLVEVTCRSTAGREMMNDREWLPRSQLASQMVTLVAKYREATSRYIPDLLGEAWNLNLFAAAAELAKTLPPNSLRS